MKNITKFFGACAAVALFSACSSEEDLATSEGMVPDGMHKVTLTVNNNVTTDETGKKRVILNMSDGKFLFDGQETDCLAVIYRNKNNADDKKIIMFMRADYSKLSDPGYENRVCESCEFTANIESDILNTMVPTDVYGSYEGDATEDDYKSVKEQQTSILQGQKDGQVGSYFFPHLHGVAQPSTQYAFTATLSMDNAAMIHIDSDNLPWAITPKNSNQHHYDITIGDNTYHVYTDAYSYYNNQVYRPNRGITFVVAVPTDGIQNPVFKVTGQGFSEEDKVISINFGTKSNRALEAGERYNLVALPSTTGTAVAKFGDDWYREVPWVQLWKDGPKFAEYNVGVKYVGYNESLGNYYTWGGMYVNGENKDWKDDHNTVSGVLSGNKDTATNTWGAKWRMPTKADFDNLLNKCEAVWTIEDGEYGYRFTGKGEYSVNSIFLPAAGDYYYNSAGKQKHEAGTLGNYWCSSSDVGGNSYATSLYFNQTTKQTKTYTSRGYACSVRAVLAE